MTAEQAQVIAFLESIASQAGEGAPVRFETHGNLVFLADTEAWKIKRAVRYSYMDFSSLEKREAACRREVEINRRFSPDLYLGCVPITRSAAGQLKFEGDGDVVEWAVHMRRFEQSALLSNIAKHGQVADRLVRDLADTVYESHQRAHLVSSSSGAESSLRLARSLCDALAKSSVLDAAQVAHLAKGLESEAGRTAAELNARAQRGCVRRCHGDLHLANIVVWQGRPALYDAIEFDDAVASIDTLYDLAFLLMDLDLHGQRRAANLVLNRYLWRSRDDLELAGLVTLPLFLALRAAVRAMVTIDRAAREDTDAQRRDFELARDYLRAALGYLAPPPPRLIVVGGLSGTGKTTLASALAPSVGGAPGAVHLRSDLERKSAAGIGELDRLPATVYTPEARRRVYVRLHEKARIALSAGCSVVVDAVYSNEPERREIEAVAAEAGVPFLAFWLAAERETLMARVAARRGDASDATSETVAEQLQSVTRPLSPAWVAIDAGGTAAATLRLATSHVGLEAGAG